MEVAMRIASLIAALACFALAPRTTSAQLVCDSSPANFNDYDPATTTSVVNGQDFDGVFVFQSPEAPDSEYVYHVGHPNGDGCIAGILAGSSDPVGVLDLARIGAYCVHFEIESAVMPRIEVYLWNGSLHESFTPTTSHVQVFSPHGSDLQRIRIVPGLDGGVRVPFCIDDVGITHPPLSTRRSSWGNVKAFYR